MKTKRSILILSLLCGLFPLSAAQAEPMAMGQKYGVITLIGEEVGLIGYQPTLGSRLDRNLRNSAKVTNAGFDTTALRVIQDSTKRYDDKAVVSLYAIKSPRLSANPSSLFEGDKVVLPPSFAAAMKEDGVSHLLLLTRKRNEARLQTANGSVGAGTVEGPGYFADGQTPIMNRETNFSSVGFLAPYISLQLTLVDLSNGKIVGRRNVYDARVLADSGQPAAGSPWAIVPDADKIAYLNRLIEDTLTKAVPALLRDENVLVPGAHNY